MTETRCDLSRRRLLASLFLAPASLLFGTGCSSGRLSVFAASSLTEALADLADGFEAATGDRVEVNLAASSVLATQILEGAPADVFVSADEVQMSRVRDAGLAEAPRIIARNTLVVIVARGARVDGFGDLARSGLRLVLAGPAVPVGRYARQVLELAAADSSYGVAFRDAVLGNVRSEELSARAVLAKVELGEADAGIVFATDAGVASEEVVSLAIPEELAVKALYPAAVVSRSSDLDTARAFLRFLVSAEGQALLVARGFEGGSEASS